jgi:hypothetical protein
VDIKQLRQITFLSLLLIFVSLQSCAPVAVKHPYYPPLTDQEIADILLALKDQEAAVHSFFSSGRMTFQGDDSEFEASVLIVGTRNPLKIKIEITHFWGRPLFHIIIKEDRIHILSFPEKRYYVGNIGESVTSNLLPVRLDTNQLWAIGRGFPTLCKYNRVVSSSVDQISLLNGKGIPVQLIDFYPESNLPLQTLLSEQGLQVSFSNFENDNNIQFAQETLLFDQKTEAVLKINIKQMVINKAIDESIFDLTIPSGFKTYRTGPLLDTQ